MLTKSKSLYNENVRDYISKLKKENESFNNKVEIFKLNQTIQKMKGENNKIPKAKILLEKYKELLTQKEQENAKLKKYNKYLYEYIQNIPAFIRKIFTKESNEKIINKFN